MLPMGRVGHRLGCVLICMLQFEVYYTLVIHLFCSSTASGAACTCHNTANPAALNRLCWCLRHVHWVVHDTDSACVLPLQLRVHACSGLPASGVLTTVSSIIHGVMGMPVTVHTRM